MSFPDNKKIVGPLDRQWVSLTEPYELRDFIDAYLQSRGFAVADEGRAIVERDIRGYSTRSPIARVDLMAHLDKKYGKAA